jgi:hypothetical protein
MLKHEWRKKEKALYLPKIKPQLIHVPNLTFATLSGEGNPNGPYFSECIKALFSVSYAVKMTLKKNHNIVEGYMDYTVYPLEGVWDLREDARTHAQERVNKDDLVFKIMIRQPEFVPENMFFEQLEKVKLKKPNRTLDHVKFESIEEGRCIQALHLGSYDSEPSTFHKMEEFAREHQLQRIAQSHREIYLSDFRKVPEEKLKTVLRFKVN